MTLQFGEQEVSPESASHFADGLPGVDGLSDFHLFHEEGQQAVKAPEVTLAVAEPRMAYELVLSDAECETLQLASSEDAAVLLLRSRDDEGNVHIRCNAPFIIHLRHRAGQQRALTDPQELTPLRAGV